MSPAFRLTNLQPSQTSFSSLHLFPFVSIHALNSQLNILIDFLAGNFFAFAVFRVFTEFFSRVFFLRAQ